VRRSFKKFKTMWRSRSKFVVIGNVAEDPEVKYIPGGFAMVRLRVSVSERLQDESGQWQERTGWHNVVAWQHLAEIVGACVRKGTKVYVEGQLQISDWEDPTSGGKKQRVEILAHDILLLDGTKMNRGEDRREANEQSESSPYDVGEIEDDDLPF
jgi:single-strand DNA-binding protein